MLKTPPLISKGLLPILIGMLAIALAVAAWAARRGFDFIDGGLYYLTYQWPEDFADTHTSYHLVGASAFRLLGHNIVAVRLATVVLTLLAAFVLSWGFNRWFRTAKPTSDHSDLPLASIPLFLLCAFSLFTIAPPALTYNSLNAFVAYVSVGLLLAALARFSTASGEGNGLGWLLLGGACLAAGFDLFIKPPTSLLLMGAILVYCFLTPVIARATKKRIALLIVGSGVIGLLLFGLVLGQWNAVLARLATIRSLMSDSAYTLTLLNRVRQECSDLAKLLIGDLWPVLVLFTLTAFAFLILRRSPQRIRSAAVIGGVAVWIAWLITASRIPAWNAAQAFFDQAAVTRFYLGTILILVGCVLARPNLLPQTGPASPDRAEPSSFHFVLGLVMLTLLPFAGAFGTTNPLYLNAAYHAPFWCAVIVALTLVLQRQWRASWLPMFIWLPVAGVAFAQYFNGSVLHPYALTTPLDQQDTATAVGSPSTTLLLDAPSHRFITDARRILDQHGFKPGDDIFAFFNLPGLVFALGGRSPVIPWYFGRIYANNPVEEHYMRAAGPERRARAWIITQADAPDFRDHYRAGGFSFPDNYDLIGELKNPVNAMEIKIWKPRASK